jgi:hypothetical protein
MRTTERGFDEDRRFWQIFVLFGAKEISRTDTYSSRRG